MNVMVFLLSVLVSVLISGMLGFYVYYRIRTIVTDLFIILARDEREHHDEVNDLLDALVQNTEIG